MQIKTKHIIYIVIFVVAVVVGLMFMNGDSNDIVDEIRAEVCEVSDGHVDSANEGKLVLVTGDISARGVSDPDFNISVPNAVRLERKVEVFRYYSSKEKDNAVFTHWESASSEAEQNLVSVDTAGNQITYSNPQDPVESKTFYSDANVGDFIVAGPYFSGWGKLTTYGNIKSVNLNQIDTRLGLVDSLNVSGIYFTTVKNDDPGVGDIRVQFGYTDVGSVGTVTVLAKQEGNKLVPYESYSGRKIMNIYQGDVSLDEMLKAQEGNRTNVYIIVIIIWVILLLAGFFVFADDVRESHRRKEAIRVANGFERTSGRRKISEIIWQIIAAACLVVTVVLMVISAKDVYYVILKNNSAKTQAVVKSITQNTDGGYDVSYTYSVDGVNYTKKIKKLDKLFFEKTTPDSEDDESGYGTFTVYYDLTSPDKAITPNQVKLRPYLYGVTLLMFILTVILLRRVSTGNVGMVRVEEYERIEVNIPSEDEEPSDEEKEEK